MVMEIQLLTFTQRQMHALRKYNHSQLAIGEYVIGDLRINWSVRGGEYREVHLSSCACELCTRIKEGRITIRAVPAIDPADIIGTG